MGKFYKQTWFIVLTLIIIFPIGLFLMWKFANWPKKAKWTVSVVLPLLMLVGFVLVGTYYGSPIITVSNAKDNKISTDDSEYLLTGDVSSLKAATLTIDDQPIPLSEDAKFSYEAVLKEGDNDFNLIATNENGETKEVLTVYRTTQAEFAARAEAERQAAEKRAAEAKAEEDATANEEAEKKADADAKAAQEKADADTRATAEAKTAAESKAEAEAQAQNNEQIDVADRDSCYVNNVYFKGDGKYDIVVYSSDKDTLRIYVNDDIHVTAKVNNEGWATFQKVELTGQWQSKLSFAKKVGWFFSYYPVNYVKYISVDNEHVKLTDTGPKHAYNEFFDWVTASYKPADLVKTTTKTYRWMYINSQCQYLGTWSDGEEDIFYDRSCLRDEYKDYIKPSAFDYRSAQEIDIDWLCPASDAKYYNWLCSRFGDMLNWVKGAQQGYDAVGIEEANKKAEAIYYEIVQTSGGN